jgi:asparagine synthase (glutamine-hydrolysing)
MSFSYTAGRPQLKNVFFSGSLYNSVELAKELQIDPSCKTEDLVLAAYMRWGTEAAHHFDGEFFLALQSPETSEVFCARDIFGIRPAFYCWNGEHFFASCTLAEVVQHLGPNLSPDLGYLGEYLTGHFVSRVDTIYSQIKRIQPGHFLTISKGGLKENSYYAVAIPEKNLDLDEHESSLKLKSLIQNSLKKRLLPSESYGLYLSGGIDSSCLAAALSELDSAQVNTFSMVFKGLDCDERSFIELVNDEFNCKSHFIESAQHSSARIRELVISHRDLPDFPNNIMCEPVKKLLLESNCRTGITGIGGDDFLTGGSLPYGELLRSFNLKRFASQLAQDPRFHSVFSILSPAFLKRLTRQLKLSQTWIPSYINEEFSSEQNLNGRLQSFDGFTFKHSISKQIIKYNAKSPSLLMALEHDYRSTTALGLKHEHPFLDRDILEFALSVPERFLAKQNINKYILRKAFQNELPSRIAGRSDKADFTFIYKNLIEGLGGREFLSKLSLYDDRILIRENVLSLYELMNSSEDYSTEQDCCIKLWLITASDIAWRELF